MSLQILIVMVTIKCPVTFTICHSIHYIFYCVDCPVGDCTWLYVPSNNNNNGNNTFDLIDH